MILWGVRYVPHPISYRQLEEMMDERGVEVDHSTLNRWVLKYVPLLETQFCARKRSVGSSWRLDETYVKVKGVWKYLYRAVDKAGATVDFLLTAKRDCKAALRFLREAIRSNGYTWKRSRSTRALRQWRQSKATILTTRPALKCAKIKYLNNIVEQDHRAIKRQIRPMLGFKSFWSAAVTLAGVELMHMIRKGQLLLRGELCSAQQFYSLAE